MELQTYTGSLGLTLLVVLFLCQQAALQQLQSPTYSATPALPGIPFIGEPPCFERGNILCVIFVLE